MSTEIERKFLVINESWRAFAGAPIVVRQGYLNRDPARTVRVRVMGEKGKLTIKGISQVAAGALQRDEFEYEIPRTDAAYLLDHVCEPPLIVKKRYDVTADDGLIWEVDEFLSPHPGLMLAEIELADAAMKIVLPHWLGREVTADPRYANSNIATATLD